MCLNLNALLKYILASWSTPHPFSPSSVYERMLLTSEQYNQSEPRGHSHREGICGNSLSIIFGNTN